MLNGHGGNIYDIAHRLGCIPSEIIDMSSNVNPLGPPPGLVNFLKQNLNVITALPEVDSSLLVLSFANRCGVDPATVLAVCYLMEHKAEVNAFIDRTHELIESEKKRFAEKFKNSASIKLFASATSFMLAKLVNRHTADAICQALLNEKILIRNCSNFKGLSNRFIRISLKNRDTNSVLVEKLLNLSLQ